MSTCPICRGATWVLDEHNEPRPCECRDGVLRRSQSRGVMSTVPPAFAELKLASGRVTKSGELLEFDRAELRPVVSYVDELDEQLLVGRGLWFSGECGVGKTTLAMLVSSIALNQGHTVAIYSVPTLLARIRDTFNTGSDLRYMEFFEQLTNVDLLHLDDLGAENQSPWVLEQLYSIVDNRYLANRSIVVTTNLTTDEVTDQMGNRIATRLADRCELVHVSGVNHRNSFVR